VLPLCGLRFLSEVLPSRVQQLGCSTSRKHIAVNCILCCKIVSTVIGLMPQQSKPKEVLNSLSEQGYSEAAAKAIKQWYSPTKKINK
jgi:hypothetical protein